MKREENFWYFKWEINNDTESGFGFEEHPFRVVECDGSGYCGLNIVFEMAMLSK